ncbi:response regulator transcription factor [Altererythrobacter sp. SALINAS58]|uniref:LuxR C-terminal-related transcriptional regulator n=1 Tax=Alteripontixanthobacter muriae TaxID=2705546 RepID=UPI00157709CF|nr:response regulator transcription factor [Alteripontixanthobacter muriae]NTZ42874.1 response regulator transcription factor [Alteripontixanthobacter muriae]
MSVDRAIIADGSNLCRIGFSTILRQPELGYSVAEATNLVSLIEHLDSVETQLLVVDSRLAGLNGLAGLGELSRHYPRTKIVASVESLTGEFALGCISIGIKGCIEKSMPSDAIVEAIQAVRKGRIYLSNSPKNSASPPGPPGSDPVSLTPQQCKVLDVLATGKSNKEIARMLGICEGTVKVHVNAAYRALGVHNRVAAVARYSRIARNASREMELSLPLQGEQKRMAGEIADRRH